MSRVKEDVLQVGHAELKDKLRDISQGFDRLRRVSHQGYGDQAGEPLRCAPLPGARETAAEPLQPLRSQGHTWAAFSLLEGARTFILASRRPLTLTVAPAPRIGMAALLLCRQLAAQGPRPELLAGCRPLEDGLGLCARLPREPAARAWCGLAGSRPGALCTVFCHPSVPSPACSLSTGHMAGAAVDAGCVQWACEVGSLLLRMARVPRGTTLPCWARPSAMERGPDHRVDPLC